ncbi:MAG: FISUMP domain-containing protein, partial [Bacteroidota bacterium]
PGTPSVTDIDGNLYHTVQIGNQCWTQSNLKVSKYRNGDNIPTGLNDSQWGSTTTGAYAIYNNDPVNDGLYGKLYNHYAVTDSRGLCPTGWHVPSDGEWNIMVKYLGPNADTVCTGCVQSSIAGGALKSTATQPTPGGWNSPNTGATNSSGFTALPGGLRLNDGDFNLMTYLGCWWSSSVSSGANAWYRFLDYDVSSFTRSYDYRTYGFSVRCLKDSPSGGSSASLPTATTTSATSITSTGATTGGNVTADGGASVTARGVAYGTVQNPSTANSTTSDGTGTGAFTSTLSGLTASTLYYVRAYATNSVGTGYGSQESFTTSATPSFTCGTSTVVDVDNNTYNTVQIGTQCWTQSNLKVSKYRNGDNIPTGLNNSDWQNTTSGAYAIYNNDPVNDGLYGKLYNHYAVTDSRGLCPTGWHVPSDGEWRTLTTFLGGSTVAGGAMKSTVTQPTPGGWTSPNIGATNSSGFTALPGGRRNGIGDFFDVVYYGYWWSSSVSSGSVARSRFLSYDNSVIILGDYRTSGFSVRCCRD